MSRNESTLALLINAELVFLGVCISQALRFTTQQSLPIGTALFARLTSSASFLTEINTISEASGD